MSFLSESVLRSLSLVVEVAVVIVVASCCYDGCSDCVGNSYGV